MVLSSIFSAGNIASFILGAFAAGIALWRYVRNHISPEEAARIYKKASDAIQEYEKAKIDGNLTTAEKLIIAEDVIAVIDEVIKDLE